MTKRRNVIVHIGTSAEGYMPRPDAGFGAMVLVCLQVNLSVRRLGRIPS